MVAGAGTGKTRVIVERVVKLIREGNDPKKLLALTFTEKAAAEMLDRINQALDSYEIQMPIMTFNAFGESLLRRYAADIGLSRSFNLMSDSGQIVFLRERLDELGLDYFSPVSNPDGPLSDIANYFSLLKQNVITPAAYNKYVEQMPSGDGAEKLDKLKHQELAQAFSKYLQLCRTANVIDYDDQLYLMIDLFENRPNIQKEVQANYEFVLVDEFQDTNRMQSVFIDLVAGKQNLFVVGDDDQSIYGWRGATLANILDFKKRYPKTLEITLVENYRTSQQILDAAYRLIQHNNPHRLEEQLHINKHLKSKLRGVKPQINLFDSLDEELQWIADDIGRRLKAGEEPGAIAVLARRNDTIRKLQVYLDYVKIEYTLAGQRYNLYQDASVRALLEALRTICDLKDNVSLYHTLAGALFNLPAAPLSNLLRVARAEHAPLVDIILQSTVSEHQAFKQAVDRIKKWQSRLGILSVGEMAYEIFDQSGFKDRLYQLSATDPQISTAGTRLSELFHSFKDFERIALQPSTVQYVAALPALMAQGLGTNDGTLDLSGRTVNLLTIHSAKGLEWSTVYIADCTEGSFPLRESSRGIELPDKLRASILSPADSHLSEERRLMYVAMTRAKDQLILTHAAHHNSATSRKPSRFLSEAFGDQNSQSPKVKSKLNLIQAEGYGLAANQAVSIPKTILDSDKVRLTISQIQTYLDCPLEFYYRYVLAVPSPPSATLEYGSLMHQLIEDINSSLLAGKLIKLSELQKKLAANWPNQGYLSQGHKLRAIKQAKTTLENYYKRVKLGQRVPLGIEDSFECSLDDQKLTIRGRFDAVFPLNESVEIVDYKTGSSVKSSEQAKSRAVASQQLTLYALAWQHLHHQLPALMTLDFVDTDLQGSVKKTQRSLDTMLDRLSKVADGIRANSFKPGKDHRNCQHPLV